MQWYYAVGEQRQGPVDQAEFERLVANATITAGTLVWRQGMADWKPYASVAAGANHGGPPAAAPTPIAPAADDGTEVCAVSGKRYPRREMIQYEGKWISAEHRDEYFQRLREGVALPGAGEIPGPFGYGGFWRRFCARFVDGLLTGAVSMLIGAVVGAFFGAAGALRPGNTAGGLLMQAVIQLLSMAVAIAYEVYFVRKYDATPGKLALGLRLLRADGAKLTVGRVVGRYFATILSALPLGIGYLVAAADEEKRTWHDRLADTRVIRTR